MHSTMRCPGVLAVTCVITRSRKPGIVKYEQVLPAIAAVKKKRGMTWKGILKMRVYVQNVIKHRKNLIGRSSRTDSES